MLNTKEYSLNFTLTTPSGLSQILISYSTSKARDFWGISIYFHLSSFFPSRRRTTNLTAIPACSITYFTPTYLWDSSSTLQIENAIFFLTKTLTSRFIYMQQEAMGLSMSQLFSFSLLIPQEIKLLSSSSIFHSVETGRQLEWSDSINGSF